MRIWKLFCAVMVVAVLASVLGLGGAQAAVAPNPDLTQPKVITLALPVAVVDTAFPVLVLVKNNNSSTIDKPVISITGNKLFTDNCTLVLPEDSEIKAYFGIPPKGYSFAMWFVECAVEGDLEICVNVVGKIGASTVTGSDCVEITVYDM
jgi:hypothetical protein